MVDAKGRAARARRLLVTVLLLVGGPAQAQMPDAEARFNAGLTHLRDGRIKMAIEEFKRAIKEDKDNPYFYKGLGLAYASEKSFDDAIAAFRKALDINPYYVDVRNDLGSALVLSGRREEGKKEFLEAFNDPTNPTPEVSSRNLGQAFFEEKRYDEAFNWFKTSLSRNKAYPDAYLGLVDTLVALGRLDEAVAQLEIAVAEVPDHPPLMLALGEAYFRAGRFAEARKQLEAVAGKDPVGTSGRRAASLLKNLPR
jgi:Tfp pilus assembly protein PilF